MQQHRRSLEEKLEMIVIKEREEMKFAFVSSRNRFESNFLVFQEIDERRQFSMPMKTLNVPVNKSSKFLFLSHRNGFLRRQKHKSAARPRTSFRIGRSQN